MTPAARDPQHMSAAERKAEIATIMATSFLRMRARNPCLDSRALPPLDRVQVYGAETQRVDAPATREEVA